jgi:hypothetical protein
MQMLVDENLSLLASVSLDPNDFRLTRLYQEEVDDLFKRNEKVSKQSPLPRGSRRPLQAQ